MFDIAIQIKKKRVESIKPTVYTKNNYLYSKITIKKSCDITTQHPMIRHVAGLAFFGYLFAKSP
jgi:hypothetical protein